MAESRGDRSARRFAGDRSGAARSADRGAAPEAPAAGVRVGGLGRREAPRPAAVRSRPADQRASSRARIGQLYEELAARGLVFRPHFWLSDEWFTPDGVPGIAIPFYLAHPRLARLELHQMLEVEGGTHEWCMKILRHEAGHAIENAYRLRRRTTPARALRPHARALSRVLRAAALQQELRHPPRRLVRAEPPRRGLRRDLRGLARPRLASGASATTTGRRCRSSSTWTS